jgi:isopentenyl-diphosphate delta-isomerase
VCKRHLLLADVLQVPLDAFQYLTRIHYRANNVPYDGIWAEHEIDYILFIQRDVTVVENPNEVKSHKYFTRTELKDLMGN